MMDSFDIGVLVMNAVMILDLVRHFRVRGMVESVAPLIQAGVEILVPQPRVCAPRQELTRLALESDPGVDCVIRILVYYLTLHQWKIHVFCRPFHHPRGDH